MLVECVADSDDDDFNLDDELEDTKLRHMNSGGAFKKTPGREEKEDAKVRAQKHERLAV